MISLHEKYFYVEYHFLKWCSILSLVLLELHKLGWTAPFSINIYDMAIEISQVKFFFFHSLNIKTTVVVILISSISAEGVKYTGHSDYHE